MTIPTEMDEAAAIDGAGPFRTLWSVLLPQAWPVVIAVAIFHLVYSWNDFFGPLIYLSSKPELQPLAVGLSRFNGVHYRDPGPHPGRNAHDPGHPRHRVPADPALLHARHRHHRRREVSDFRVALTFDTEHPDRPCAARDDRGAPRCLARRHASARRSSSRVAGPRRTRKPWRGSSATGTSIGNHSHYHARMPLLTDAGLAEDLADAAVAIEAAAGRRPATLVPLPVWRWCRRRARPRGCGNRRLSPRRLARRGRRLGAGARRRVIEREIVDGVARPWRWGRRPAACLADRDARGARADRDAPRRCRGAVRPASTSSPTRRSAFRVDIAPRHGWRSSRSTAATRRRTSRSWPPTAGSWPRSAARPRPTSRSDWIRRRSARGARPRGRARTVGLTWRPSRTSAPVAEVAVYALAGADAPADHRRLRQALDGTRTGAGQPRRERCVCAAPGRIRRRAGASP